MNKILIICAILFVASCGTTIRTNVEAYSSIAESTQDQSVYIAPTQGQDTKSISWTQNTAILTNELRSLGFNVVSSKGKADYIAYFGYAVDDGRLVTTNYSIPTYGVTGYSGANTYGSVYGNSYSATTTLTPTYGVTGYSSGSRTDKVFTRSAKLYLVKKNTGKTVFEGQATSSGSCHAFAPVAPYIIRSVLQNYPNGKVGTVDFSAENFDC